MSECKTNALKYWKSWQIGSPQDMKETVSDEFEMYVFGEKTSMNKEMLVVCSFENGVPWNDVEMISEIYTDRSAALYYRGISTATQKSVFVSEHLMFDDDLKITQAQTMIFPPPNLDE